MHSSRYTSYEMIKEEVLGVVTSREATGIVPMMVDALSKGKGKGKDKKGKYKSKTPPWVHTHAGENPDKDKTCFYCDKKGHTKDNCWKRMKDMETAKAAG